MANFIFDFDGTLADTLPQYLAALYKTNYFDMDTLQPGKRQYARQISLHKVFGYLQASPLARLRLLWFHHRHMHAVIVQARLFAGVQEMIKNLAGQGHRLFIVTSNTERNVSAFLSAKRLEHYFEDMQHVFVARKAAGLAKFIRRKHLQLSETFCIGNEQTDMAAASQVGARAVGVLWSGQDKSALRRYNPAAIVSSPAELLKLVQ